MDKLFERFTIFPLLLFCFSANSWLVSGALKECNRPLGLQDGRILNSQLSSSAHSGYLYIGNEKTANMKAEFARLNNTLAWCSPFRRKFGSTFIEIDLNQQMNISGIATQGFRGVTAYYVKQYKVAYSKERITWKFLEKVWTGNSDAQTVVKNTFNTVISTRYLRIYPVTWNIRVCMRMELYGCTNLTMDTNPETPVVTTPTVTVPITTVQTLQSTVTSSSHVMPTLREEITNASKESVPTLHSGATKATTKAVNNVLSTVNKMKEPHHTTTVKVPLSVSSEEPVVAAQTDQEEEYFQNDKPVHLTTSLIVTLSVASVFVVVVMVPVIMFVIFLHRRKQRRCHCPDNCDGIPLHAVLIDEKLCNQDFYDTYKYDAPTEKSDAVDFNLLNPGAV